MQRFYDRNLFMLTPDEIKQFERRDLAEFELQKANLHPTPASEPVIARMQMEELFDLPPEEVPSLSVISKPKLKPKTVSKAIVLPITEILEGIPISKKRKAEISEQSQQVAKKPKKEPNLKQEQWGGSYENNLKALCIKLSESKEGEVLADILDPPRPVTERYSIDVSDYFKNKIPPTLQKYLDHLIKLEKLRAGKHKTNVMYYFKKHYLKPRFYYLIAEDIANGTKYPHFDKATRDLAEKFKKAAKNKIMLKKDILQRNSSENFPLEPNTKSPRAAHSLFPGNVLHSAVDKITRWTPAKPGR